MENGILHRVSRQLLIRGQGLTKQQSYVGFVMDNVSLKQVFGSLPQLIPLVFHTHIHYSSAIH